MLFLVKSKWNLNKVHEFSRKIARGEIRDISKWGLDGFCLEDDPSTNFNLYEAADEYDLKRKWFIYEEYAEILEIYPVVKLRELMERI